MSRRLRRALRPTPIVAPTADAAPLLDAPRPWGRWRQIPLAQLTGPRPHGVTEALTNDWFAVLVRPMATGLHLMIRNRPNTPVRSWRDLQRIKNEVCGPEAFAIEVFPPDDEVIDQANVTHLWVFTDPTPLLPCSLVQWTAEAQAAGGEA